MDETHREIEQFERRLELKTIQEGLKHKAASTDLTPSIVYDVSRITVDDFTHRMMIPSSTQLAPMMEEGANISYQNSPEPPAETGQYDLMPEVEDPPTRGVPYVKDQTAPEVESRKLVIKMLHAASLLGPELAWKAGGGGGAALLCNPMCMVRYGHEFAHGKTIKGSRNPIFKDSFEFHAPAAGPLGVVTLDVVNVEGGGKPNTLVGSAEISVDALGKLAPGKPVQRWVELEGGRGGRMHCEVGIVHVEKK